VSGKKTDFQSKIDKPIDYHTAIMTHEIWIYPSLIKCHTCMPNEGAGAKPLGVGSLDDRQDIR
jgi:hypothetical protein